MTDRYYYRCVLCGRFIGYNEQGIRDISVQTEPDYPDPEYAHPKCLQVLHKAVDAVAVKQ